MHIGVEQIAWENPSGHQRVTVEMRATCGALLRPQPERAVGAAVGLAAGCQATPRQLPPAAPASTGRATPASTSTAAATAPYPGVSETEAYGIFGGDAGSTSRSASTSASAASSG